MQLSVSISLLKENSRLSSTVKQKLLIGFVEHNGIHKPVTTHHSRDRQLGFLKRVAGVAYVYADQMQILFIHSLIPAHHVGHSVVGVVNAIPLF